MNEGYGIRLDEDGREGTKAWSVERRASSGEVKKSGSWGNQQTSVDQRMILDNSKLLAELQRSQRRAELDGLRPKKNTKTKSSNRVLLIPLSDILTCELTDRNKHSEFHWVKPLRVSAPSSETGERER